MQFPTIEILRLLTTRFHQNNDHTTITDPEARAQSRRRSSGSSSPPELPAEVDPSLKSLFFLNEGQKFRLLYHIRYNYES